jgi:hypothetical protein
MTAEHPRAATISVRGSSREGHGPSCRTHGAEADGSLSPFALRRLARMVHLACPVAGPSGTPVKTAEVIAAASALLTTEATVATATPSS